MKLFSIKYANQGYEGLAIVAACSMEKARILLQSYGNLNSDRYRCVFTREIGCTDSSVESIIEDSYKEPTIIGTPIKFDVNKLTEEDIKLLKARLDKYNE